ncbi:MAG: sigma 54-interacting transcriptional regulator [Negativicutes bacterium]
MSKLSQNRDSVQQVAEAIASVLSVEVTIVDNDLCRIAGTGRYALSIGERLDKDSAFARVLRDRQGFVISSPGQDSACMTCDMKMACTEQAEVCCPILLGEEAIGIIALIAFDEQQRRTLLAQSDRLLDFLDRMADLLANKVVEQERVIQLKTMQKQIETIINTVQEGIVATDNSGRIINLNSAAAGMLQINPEEAPGHYLMDYLPRLPVVQLLEQKNEWSNRETFRMINGRKIYFIVTTKLWRDGDEICGLVATIRELSEVRKFVSNISTQTHYYTLDMILGNSPVMVRVKQEAALAAAGTATVLIQGESGTGKELFARAIHCAGERREKPFIAINCAAIPEALLESELFGYEEGAFTGAKRGGKPGKFELADGGTVFLDEIGDMSLSIQSKLLRVLQERRIERVGGVGSSPVDVRILAATHKDVEGMVGRGEFRQDLFYRINVFPLRVPSLRERTDDLPLLIETFLARYCQALNKEFQGIENEVYQWLIHYSWPGNIRELENTMEYLVNIETAAMITEKYIPDRIKLAVKISQDPQTSASSLAITSIAVLEHRAILQALQHFGTTTDGKEKAARALGISKATLYRKLKENTSQ